MKKSLLFIPFLAIGLLIAGCGQQPSSNNSPGDSTHVATDSTKTASQYTCPMHPEVVSDTPGTCPKCGMDLEPKT